MEVLARKPGRVLWTAPDAEGRTRYEWRATTAEGVAIEPASCNYTSRHQANLAWAADNPPAPPGRPRTASEANRKAGGNPPLLLRLTPELHEAAQARGGASWVRSLIEKDLKESTMKTAYIARETLAPGFPAEDVSKIVELMTEDLETQGYEVSVGDLVRRHDDGEETQDAVTAAWEKACSSL